MSDTPRVITGVFRDPTGTTYPNSRLTWRKQGGVLGQGGSVIVDEVVETVLTGSGALPTGFALVPGTYRVSVTLSEGVRVFAVAVPAGTAPIDASVLVTEGGVALVHSLSEAVADAEAAAEAASTSATAAAASQSAAAASASGATASQSAAATSASGAAASASSAANSAGIAEAAAIVAGAQIFASTAAGLAGTDDGGFFYVPQYGGLMAYQNDGGEAVFAAVVGAPVFASRTALVAAVGLGFAPPLGTIVSDGTLRYIGAPLVTTTIADLPGMVPIEPYRLAHFGSKTVWTVAASGGDFPNMQAAIDFAGRFSAEDDVTIQVNGTVAGGFALDRDLNHVTIVAQTPREAGTREDYIAALKAVATPAWDGTGDDDSDSAATNTLFAETRAALATLMRSKYSSVIEVASGSGIDLRGFKLKRISDILLINTGTAQRGITTGESVMTGSGANMEGDNIAVVNFGAAGAVTNYGGTLLFYNSSDSFSIFAGNGDSGLSSQYGGVHYAQDAICFANFSWGARVKQNGIVYTGRGYCGYNRLDGASTVAGGYLNLAGGVMEGNGSYGVNVSGTATAEFTGGTATGNLSGGIRSQDGGIIITSNPTITNNLGPGAYAPNGFIRMVGGTVTGNTSHAAWAQGTGRIIADGATLANSSAGMGARVDDDGQIDAPGAVIYGNVNAFGKQVFVAQSGRIDITGAVDDEGSPLSDSDSTPPPNRMTEQGAFVLNSASNSPVTLLRSTDVTSSATDTTEGKLIKVGDHGPTVLSGFSLESGATALVADDAVATFPVPDGRQSGIAIIGPATGPITWQVMVAYRSTSGATAIEKCTGWSTAGSLVDVVNGDVTGTTGTDGRLTIGIVAGALKAENRLGALVNMTCRHF